ncbi:MAG: hypothetical protein HYY52_08415 [Candidatus Melainabacteria bacterium]|nr:hypothetical protein [Candidatus Melainabacteria bacterium]
MNKKQRKIFILLYFLAFLLLCLSLESYSQTNAVKKYDELINPPLQVSPSPLPEIPANDELVLLLPVLDSTLYKDWVLFESPQVWKAGSEIPFYLLDKQDILYESGIEKVLKVSYKQELSTVEVLIYKFKDLAGAYSAYTIFHYGEVSKLKVGRNVTESNKLLNFWKGNYYIDIHALTENDATSKEFIILYSQDSSKNIQAEKLPPVVAIQLPALYRVQGSEKYCLGEICCKRFLANNDLDIDFSNLNIKESEGIIKAEYQLSEDIKDKDKDTIQLLLARYIKKETAQSVFNLLEEKFEKKKMDMDIDDSTVIIKIKKDDYLLFKQKGNLLAIAYAVKNKKSGEQILKLVPWPIEITKPIVLPTEK